MSRSVEVTFSERPPYDPGMVDAVFSRYCTVTVNTEKTVRKGGVDVTKRKEAILNSLAASKAPVHVFGELEYGMIKKGH